MKVARLRLQRFRGFEGTVIVPAGHAVVIGEPGAGRSDTIRALRRVLSARSTAARVDPLDVYRDESAPEDQSQELTEVEVTLTELGTTLEQRFDTYLEPFDPVSGEAVQSSTSASTAVLGIRLCYRLEYDEITGTGQHWVDYPAAGDPAAGDFVRVARQDRESLPFITLDRAAALQLRADGMLRGLVDDSDTAALSSALQALGTDVLEATKAFSSAPVIRQQLAEILGVGAGRLLELPESQPEDQFTFQTEDGSIAGLLRTVQPALALDAAGTLPLSSHGSTVAAVLSASEAIVAARTPGAIVVSDDFGDDLDTASAEFLAATLRRGSDQLWLSTRRPDVVRAFRPEEIVRLTRHDGNRQHHQLASTTDRKERGARRQIQLLLLPAMTARTLVLMEGPHDVDGYSALVARRLRTAGIAPPSAYGMSLLAPPGGDGGKDRLPDMAKLANQMGFRVRVVLDHDKPGTDTGLIAKLQGLAEAIIRLPERFAVERAIVYRLPETSIRKTLEWLSNEYGLGINVSQLAAADLYGSAVEALKKKGGLHQPWVDALPNREIPPVATAVLDAITDRSLGGGVLEEVPKPT